MSAPVEVPLLKHQWALLADTDSRMLGLVAGFGAGKTYAACIKALQLADLNHPHVGIVLEPTYRMIEDVIVPTFRDILDTWGAKHWLNKRDSDLRVELNGRELLIRLRNSTDALKLAGSNLAYAIIDEADQHSEAAAKMVSSRVREPRAPVRQIVAVGTPEGAGSWFHRWFELAPLPGARLIRARTTDNAYLDEDYVRQNLAGLTDIERQRYVEGFFVSNTGRVYTKFDREVHAQPCVDPWEGSQWMGVDFGRNIAWSFGRSVGDVMHVHGQLTREGTDTIDAIELALDFLSQRYSRWEGRHVDRLEAAQQTAVYCDPAGAGRYKLTASDVRLMREAGFTVMHRPRHPAVKDRVNAVQTKLHHRELFIDPEAAPYIVRALEGQQYGEDGAPQKGRTRDGLKDLSHANDALGYAVEYMHPCAIGSPSAHRFH